MRMGAAALCLVLAAAGSATAAEGVTRYPASFFAEAQPYSALDMVRRLPGFTLDGGDDEVRGLSGSVGNVLVDGERPATKDELDEVLARIPAAEVDRIELIRAGAPGVDMRGHTLLANVVRVRLAQATGQAEAGIFAYADGGLGPKLRFQHAVGQGERRTERSLHAYSTPFDEGGDGQRLRFAPSGMLLRQADYDVDGRTDGLELTGGHQRAALGGRIDLQLSLELERFSAETRELGQLPTAALAVQDERESVDAVEAGFNLDRPLGESQLTVLALQRLARTVETEVVSGDDPEGFRSRSRTGETVASATLQRPLSPTAQLKTGAEAAYNFLDGLAALEEDGESVELPDADVEVEEIRGELTAEVAWRSSSGVFLDGGARLEGSELRHSAGVTKTFVYLKPRLVIGLERPGGFEARLRAEREVSQLDFEDFASSASLISDNVSTGNADLEPEAKWVLEAEIEQKILGRGAIVISYRFEAIDNVLDRVAVVGPDEVFDAPGNLSAGRRHVVGLAFNLPLERFGVPGGLLTGEVSWVNSSVRDPVTGDRRRISGDDPLEGDIHFSQDLPAWRFRWGVDVALPEEDGEYRFDEVEVVRTGTSVAAFAEYAPAPGWRIRLDAGNLTARAIRLRREVYHGARNANSLDYTDDRRLRFGPFVGITLRRSY